MRAVCGPSRYEVHPRARRPKNEKPVRAHVHSASAKEMQDIREKVKAAKEACFLDTNERCDAAWEITEHVLQVLATVYSSK